MKRRTLSDIAVLGVWTPGAEILCFACHGPLWLFSKDKVPNYETVCSPRPAKEEYPGIWEKAGKCDRCGEPVWLSEELADEQAVVLAIRAMELPGVTAAMQQTGGMCSAASAYFGGKMVLVTVDEEDPTFFCVGLYENEEAMDDCFIESSECKTSKDVAEKVREWATGDAVCDRLAEETD
jgi:hypothetical protein